MDGTTTGKQRIVGTRRVREMTFDASGENLKRGCEFNDEIHRTFGTRDNGVPKGVYRFKTHKEANEHQEMCMANKMARIAISRKAG